MDILIGIALAALLSALGRLAHHALYAWHPGRRLAELGATALAWCLLGEIRRVELRLRRSR